MLKRLSGLSKTAIDRTRALLGGAEASPETGAGADAAERADDPSPRETGEARPTSAPAEKGEPRVLARESHPVSRKTISRSALKVLDRLHEGGFGAYLVGGGVRDALVGIVPKDFDVATDASPEDVRALFRNSRIIGRRFRLVHVVFGREIIEVATFRAAHDKGEGGEVGASGRIVRDNVFGSISEDAHRRDFSVNALYYNAADRTVLDYVGGLEDIERRVFRLIGDPGTRCAEDPVRVLRAVRLAAKLEFGIDPATLAAMEKTAPELRHTPPARLFEEVLKLFQGGYAERSFAAIVEHDLLKYLFPLLERRLSAAGADDDGDAAGLRAMLDAALANTDLRVAQGKPITPAYLLAFMLWPDVEARAREQSEAGVPVHEALYAAAESVLAEQLRTISIPRRFSGPMKEIWQMQPRLERQRGARAVALLGERRFRAAYDFLCLRARTDERLGPSAEWWTTVQELPEEEREAAAASRPLAEGIWASPLGEEPPGTDRVEDASGGGSAGSRRRRGGRSGRGRRGGGRAAEARGGAEGNAPEETRASGPDEDRTAPISRADGEGDGRARDEGTRDAGDARETRADAAPGEDGGEGGTPKKRRRRRRRRRPGGDRARVPDGPGGNGS